MKNGKYGLIALIVTAIGIGIAFLGSQNGQECCGYPVFLICVAFAFILNWVVFIPAYIFQTEKFYDLTGTLTYLSVTALALYCTKDHNLIVYLMAGLVFIWAIRLGTFLFTRIHRTGKDDRFDSIKPNFFRFINAWTIQALWVVLTAAPVFIAITSATRIEPNVFTWVGLILWIIGFGIEVIADSQKSAFRKVPENKGKFISTGLWSKSRHPNYFGEILLWLGVTVIAFPILKGGQYIALISPIFVYLLLTKVSGVPMLENKADKTWGGQKEYEEYKKNTPVLIPKL